MHVRARACRVLVPWGKPSREDAPVQGALEGAARSNPSTVPATKEDALGRGTLESPRGARGRENALLRAGSPVRRTRGATRGKAGFEQADISRGRREFSSRSAFLKARMHRSGCDEGCCGVTVSLEDEEGRSRPLGMPPSCAMRWSQAACFWSFSVRPFITDSIVTDYLEEIKSLMRIVLHGERALKGPVVGCHDCGHRLQGEGPMMDASVELSLPWFILPGHCASLSLLSPRSTQPHPEAPRYTANRPPHPRVPCLRDVSPSGPGTPTGRKGPPRRRGRRPFRPWEARPAWRGAYAS